MRKWFIFLMLAVGAVACTDREADSYSQTKEDRGNEVLAAQNSMCAFENQSRCSHLIENRLLLSRFFMPQTLGGMGEAEKLRGRRVTTRFVVETAASVKQCRRVADPSITLLRDVNINGTKWRMEATKPVNENSLCFLIPEPEVP